MPTHDDKDSSVVIYRRCWMSEWKEAQVRKEHASAASSIPVVHASPGSHAVADNR